ncbi:MAG: type II toxin-antitoxin system Phd/YefM family antitoxin [Deltaproteobacteria bacterium]|nr:MAG: type II toxin-antitoxin system Phd/YefM family antitoxin [Deltaproteobacteria bacterium]
MAQPFDKRLQVSKSQFKPRALEYFREVERTGREIVITDRGRPVLRIVPYHRDVEEQLAWLRDSVIEYQRPCDPVAEDDWESGR